MAKKKELTLAESIGKRLKLNKNQIAALEEYGRLYGNLEGLVTGKSVYQIGCNLRSKDLIRLYFTEV